MGGLVRPEPGARAGYAGLSAQAIRPRNRHFGKLTGNLGWNSSEAYAPRLKLGTDARGYHALWWMQHAYLQLGRIAKGRENLAVIEQDALLSKP